MKQAGARRVSQPPMPGAVPLPVMEQSVRAIRTNSESFLGNYCKVLKRLAPGDVLMVTRLDRFARSTRDQLNTLDTIGKVGAGFKSLSDAWADTTTPHGQLMLTVLGGLAEFEHELIRARAKAREACNSGARLGSCPSLP